VITSPRLLEIARLVARNAYAPYSKFRVGAAVQVGDKVFAGCNVENASYGLTICAERNAIFQAVAAGHRQIHAMALSCVDADEGASLRMPCGACRQVIAEFARGDLPIEIEGAGVFTLSDLLPSPFKLSKL
jgi:cytidine deaminase